MTTKPITPAQNTCYCDTCDGMGVVGETSSSVLGVSYDYDDCEACKGTGLVAVHTCANCGDTDLVGGAFEVDGECACDLCVGLVFDDPSELPVLVRQAPIHVVSKAIAQKAVA